MLPILSATFSDRALKSRENGQQGVLGKWPETRNFRDWMRRPTMTPL